MGDWQKFEYDFSVLKNRIFFAAYSALFISMCYGFFTVIALLALFSVIVRFASFNVLVRLDSFSVIARLDRAI